MTDKPLWGATQEKHRLSAVTFKYWLYLYLHKAWEPVSSSDSSRVVTGSRSGKERRGAPPVAILAPDGTGGGREGWGRTDLWPGQRAQAPTALGRLGSSRRMAWHSEKEEEEVLVILYSKPYDRVKCRFSIDRMQKPELLGVSRWRFCSNQHQDLWRANPTTCQINLEGGNRVSLMLLETKRHTPQTLSPPQSHSQRLLTSFN